MSSNTNTSSDLSSNMSCPVLGSRFGKQDKHKERASGTADQVRSQEDLHFRTCRLGILYSGPGTPWNSYPNPPRTPLHRTTDQDCACEVSKTKHEVGGPPSQAVIKELHGIERQNALSTDLQSEILGNSETVCQTSFFPSARGLAGGTQVL